MVSTNAMIAAYRERSAPNPETGEPGILRDEWRVRGISDFMPEALTAAWGSDWRCSRPCASHVLEHRYVRRGVEEPWRLFDAANDHQMALEYVDGSAVALDPELIEIQTKRAAAAEAARHKADVERTVTVEREAHARREARSAAAFRRLATSSRDQVWADRWNAFVVQYHDNEAMKAQVLNNIRLYDAVLAAETVPAKRKAIKAFLVAFEKADDVR